MKQTKLFLFNLYDSEINDEIPFLLETNKTIEELREFCEKLQEEYDKKYMDFEDFDEVDKWVKERCKKEGIKVIDFEVI